jgi:hypothetical protein
MDNPVSNFIDGRSTAAATKVAGFSMTTSLAKPDLSSRDMTLHNITDFVFGDGIKRGTGQGNPVKPIKSFLRTAVALWVMFAHRSVLLPKNRST